MRQQAAVASTTTDGSGSSSAVSAERESRGRLTQTDNTSTCGTNATTLLNVLTALPIDCHSFRPSRAYLYFLHYASRRNYLPSDQRSSTLNPSYLPTRHRATAMIREPTGLEIPDIIIPSRSCLLRTLKKANAIAMMGHTITRTPMGRPTTTAVRAEPLQQTGVG